MSDPQRGTYYAALLEASNQGMAVHSYEPENGRFEILCQSAIRASELNRRPSTIKHIGFFTWGLRLGGAERVVCLLSELLQSVGYKVTFFTDEPQTSGDYPHSAARVVLSLEPTERWNQIQEFCHSLQVDLCLFADHFETRMLHDLLAAKLAGRLVIPWEHSSFFFPLYRGRPVVIHRRDKAYHAADAVACLSDTHADFWKAAGHRRAVALPNPLTFDRTLCPRTTGQEKNIIFIGHLREFKGAKTALRVLADLRVSVPEARLFFLGRFATPTYEMECRALAHDLHITEHVNFEGQVTDISPYLARAAAHIMPSQCEGSPMVLMEAKAHGVPSVLFEMKYLDLASEKHGCVMVGKNDWEGMSVALTKLLQDHDYWQIMSDRAYSSLNLVDNQDVLRRWQILFTNLEQGRVNSGNDGNSAYTNDPAMLLELAIREMTCAMSSYEQYPEHNPPEYLLIRHFLDKCLPADSRRRRYAKAIVRKIWSILSFPLRERLLCFIKKHPRLYQLAKTVRALMERIKSGIRRNAVNERP